MPKQAKKIKVPINAPSILVTLNGMVTRKRQELVALIESGQAYAKSVRLDPSKDYRFTVEGDQVYAIEQEAPTVKAAAAKE